MIQQRLYPDTTIFLGDLFDGGREWATGQSTSPEKRYKKYGESYWHKEYRRFSSIFFDTWREAGVRGRPGQPSRRRLLTNIPGNHDLGFASGIQEPVRKRFNAYFGEGNDVWIIGNHTVVSIDTVSLSAKEDEGADITLWKPAQEFLNGFQAVLHRKLATEAASAVGDHSTPLYKQQVVDTDELASARLPSNNLELFSTYPIILLSHIPLYRDPGTPCGPFREKWPQSTDSNGDLLEVDERNAIAVHRGYQYQNVLSHEISKEITTKLENISYAFSGDDHDYCEVVHRRYPSGGDGIRERTVKSISWAMGVRKPGIQLVSIWNPIDEYGNAILAKSARSLPKNTLQSQLCLLPDQLALFMRYGLVLGMTLVYLGLRAVYLVANPKHSSLTTNSAEPLLPTSRSLAHHETIQGQSSSSDERSDGSMTKRSRLTIDTSLSRAGSRTPSPRPSQGYGLPASGSATRAYASSKVEASDWYIPGSTLLNRVRNGTGRPVTATRSYGGLALFKRELQWSILKLVCIVLPWYAWLIYHD